MIILPSMAMVLMMRWYWYVPGADDADTGDEDGSSDDRGRWRWCLSGRELLTVRLDLKAA